MRRFRSNITVQIGLIILVLACFAGAQTDLAELKMIIPDIELDIRYATTHNFVGQVLYPSARCFLVRDAAIALKDVQADLKTKGYKLKVFDGYRPLSVQWRMWAIMPNPSFVADPKTGSRHNKGYAVDLTLISIDGDSVEMPTPYDDFTEKASRSYQNLPESALKNRQLLEDTMKAHGFTGMSSEWWHFDYQGYQDKPNLDIPIDQVLE
ncbi:MAG: M15 family metallopeptidase [Candidatus Marinimicrobia bacterium]|jgi:D-alanyl-D-alanine dipeptidase|nr:M15 family metallopeptidase [Candidatus Neomarinimicrobiota bacterium]